jgi:hypothetical protein
MVISLKAPTGTLTNGESAVYKSFSDTVINTSIVVHRDVNIH